MLWNLKCNFKLLSDLLPEVASSSIFSQEGLRPRHSAAAASSASTCSESSWSSGSSWCHSSRNCVHTVDVAMKNFRELDNNSCLHYQDVRRRNWKYRRPFAMHDVDICSWLLTLWQTQDHKPTIWGWIIPPIQGFAMGWTHCNPLSQHHQPVFNDNIILETLGLHSAWRSIRQQRKCDDERLGVDIWQLRFCEMLHLLSRLVHLTIAKSKLRI